MVSFGLYFMMPGLNQWSSCAGENKNNHPLEPVITTLKRLRQEDNNFEASSGYIVSETLVFNLFPLFFFFLKKPYYENKEKMLVWTKLVAKETKRLSLGNVLEAELPCSPHELDVQVGETEEPRKSTHVFSSGNWQTVLLINQKMPRRTQSSLMSVSSFPPYTHSFTDHEFTLLLVTSFCS